MATTYLGVSYSLSLHSLKKENKRKPPLLFTGRSGNAWASHVQCWTRPNGAHDDAQRGEPGKATGHGPRADVPDQHREKL
jgi:hypothetical protein